MTILDSPIAAAVITPLNQPGTIRDNVLYVTTRSTGDKRVLIMLVLMTVLAVIPGQPTTIPASVPSVMIQITGAIYPLAMMA